MKGILDSVLNMNCIVSYTNYQDLTNLWLMKISKCSKMRIYMHQVCTSEGSACLGFRVVILDDVMSYNLLTTILYVQRSVVCTNVLYIKSESTCKSFVWEDFAKRPKEKLEPRIFDILQQNFFKARASANKMKWNL